MKYKIVILLLVVISSCKEAVKSNKEENAVAHENTKVEQKEVVEKTDQELKGDFTKPLKNPNNNTIAFSDISGNKLFIQNKNQKPELFLEIKNIGNNFSWSKDGRSLLYKEKTKDYKVLVKSIDIESKKTQTLELPKFVSLKALSITTDTIYALDAKTLAVKATSKGKEWNVTTTKGNYYNVEVSPDNKYLIAHNGSKINLYKTSGEFVRELGQGIATSWHKNSKQIIGFLDTSIDGHQISGSELYLYHIDKSEPIKITNTANILEMWPTFKNEKDIIYRDETNNSIVTQSIATFLE